MPESSSDSEGQVSEAETTATETPSEPTDANLPVNSSTTDDTPQEGSTDAKEPTLLESVQEALNKTPEDEAADSSSAKGSEDGADADEGKPEGDADDGDGDGEKLPPFHDHPRWKKIVSERDELQEKLDATQEDHEAMDRLRTFSQEQQLSGDEVNQLLLLGGMLKNDPAKFMAAFEPTYQQLRTQLGLTLPPDLQQAVDDGLTTPEFAAQTAQSRAQANIAEAQRHRDAAAHQVRTDERDAEEAERQRTEQVNILSNAGDEWEAKWSASDPDYSVKAGRVQDLVKLAAHEGTLPSTPAELTKVLDGFKIKVETELRSILPKKRAIDSQVISTGAGSTNTSAEPKTLREAVESAL